MGNYSLSTEKQAKAVAMIKGGRTAREIAEALGSSAKVIRHLAKRSNLQCRYERVYNHQKVSEEGGKWVNLVARNSGLPDNMI